jgi:hypothetical protein
MAALKWKDLVYELDTMRVYAGGKWLRTVPLKRTTRHVEFASWREQLEELGAVQVSPCRPEAEDTSAEPEIWRDGEGDQSRYIVAVHVGRAVELVTTPDLGDLVRLLTELRAAGLLP